MGNDSRLKNSMRNTVFGMVGMMAMLLVSFISKSIFIKELGSAFNGVDYLFKGILNALNLAELGFASAIAFALYKPLSTGDEETVAALMNFFKKVYRIVAAVIAVAGSLCIPFLQYLIKEDFSTLPYTLNEIRIYYVIYLLNTVLSYLLAYKRTIVTADQKAYIVTTVDYTFNILLNILQIVLLIVFKSYYAFLFIMIAKTVINNIVIAVIANKKYPYLLKLKDVKLVSEEKKKLFMNVRALLLHQIGGVIVLNTSTIVVSAIAGVMENSLYGNYMMICNQVLTFINIVFNSVTASVGNLCAEESIDRQVDIFNKMHYLSLWLGYFVFICFVCLFNPFMDIWLGEGMTFGIFTVAIISLYQSITYLRKVVLTFRDAKGLFRKDRYKPLLEAAVSISLAILLGRKFGVFGVILGYTIATLFVATPIEQWVVIKKGFNLKLRKYVFINIFLILLTFVVTIGMYFLTNLLGKGIGWFILKLLLCLTIPNIIFVLLTFKTKEFKYYWNLIKTLFSKIIKK